MNFYQFVHFQYFFDPYCSGWGYSIFGSILHSKCHFVKIHHHYFLFFHLHLHHHKSPIPYLYHHYLQQSFSHLNLNSSIFYYHYQQLSNTLYPNILDVNSILSHNYLHSLPLFARCHFPKWLECLSVQIPNYPNTNQYLYSILHIYELLQQILSAHYGASDPIYITVVRTCHFDNCQNTLHY